MIFISIDTRKPVVLSTPTERWSGEATRMSGFMVEDTRVDVTIGDESPDNNAANHRKERPIWMMESTVINADGSQVDLYVLLLIFFINLVILHGKIFGWIY